MCSGANNISIWSCEDASETTELNSKVAVCLSARAYHNFICTDLSPNRLYNGHTLAPFCTTWNVKVDRLRHHRSIVPSRRTYKSHFKELLISEKLPIKRATYSFLSVRALEWKLTQHRPLTITIAARGLLNFVFFIIHDL